MRHDHLCQVPTKVRWQVGEPSPNASHSPAVSFAFSFASGSQTADYNFEPPARTVAGLWEAGAIDPLTKRWESWLLFEPVTFTEWEAEIDRVNFCRTSKRADFTYCISSTVNQGDQRFTNLG